MRNSCKLMFTTVASMIMLSAASYSQAALVKIDLIGDVLIGDELFPNTYGLTAGDTISATGIFDDSVLVGGSGTINFGSGSGNTLSINVGGTVFNANDDDAFAGGSDPFITLNAFTLADLDFAAHLTNGAPGDFNSSFDFFDDFDNLLGQWRSAVTITAVPVPAAVWLFGSGLLGLVGIARRKKNKV